MTMVPLAIALERIMPLMLFALYLITSVRLCRYAHWRSEGAPNPFLPRRLQPVLRPHELRVRLQVAQG